MHNRGTESDVFDNVLIKMVNFHELWEKAYQIFDIIMESQLTEVIHALKEQFSFVSNQSCIIMTSNNFVDVVEDQIIPQKSWSSLVDLCLVVNHPSLLYCIQSQFYLRIDSHPSTPDENLAVS